MGLGRAFSAELATRGYDLILVSLPCDKLEAVAQECRAKGVDCVCYEFDLTDRGSIMEFIEDVNAKYEVSMLINNAGFGGSKAFETTPFEYIEGMMNLNVVATTTLSHQLLPNLKRQAPAYILNISSMASLIPSGYKTVYPASKVFLRYLSLGLHEELRDVGVHVCIATLGPMPTKDDVIMRIEAQGALGRALTAPTEKVARLCIDALLRGDSEIIVGRFNALCKFLIGVLPTKLLAKIMTRKVGSNEIS